MEQFPAQSHAAKEPREVQPVTVNPGRIRKVSTARRLRENFFQGDARSVWSAMFWDVFVQGIRDNVADSLQEGVDTLFRGQGGGGYRRTGRSSRSFQNNKYSPDKALGGRGSERISPDDKRRQNTGGIELDSRVEAEEVLRQMNQTLDQFDVVTLAEFYQLVRITPDHTDYKFGWEDLGGAEIQHSRGVYYLNLPPAQPLR